MRRLLAASLAALFLSAGSACAQAIIVGILEDRAPSVEGETHSRPVRAVFHKEGDAWRAYDAKCLQARCYPRETNWTVGFDGREVGRVTARTPQRWSLIADVGRQTIAAGATAPTQGARTGEFAGFPGEPVYRPLVATSSRSVADPEHWHRATLTPTQRAAILKRFRARYPRAQRCAKAEQTVPAPWPYADSNVTIDGAYGSSRGWTIARAYIPLASYRCDGAVGDGGEGPFVSQTMAVAQDGSVRDLGPGMTLIDAGDYDGDVVSELFFKVSIDESDGYRIFSRNFAQNAVFQFNYH